MTGCCSGTDDELRAIRADGSCGEGIEDDAAATNCVRWDEISSWTSMGKWVDQSIISPIWGDYGDGEMGVILQYLSVGNQVVFWMRRCVARAVARATLARRARYARARGMARARALALARSRSRASPR